MNTAFHRSAAFVVERLLGAVPPGDYIDQIARLNDACAQWFEDNPDTRLLLKVPDLLKNDTLLTGNLDSADALGMCGDDTAREFIRTIDERTGHTATLLMLQICVLIQQGQAAKDGVNAKGGRA